MTRCPICDAARSRPRYEVNGHRLLECLVCGGYYLDGAGQSAPADYQARYLQRDGSDGSSLSGYFDYEAELELHLSNFRENLRIVEAHARGRRLLDVGCASGHFLVAASRAGFDVAGVDMSEQAIEQVHRLGFPGWAGDLARLELEGGYDVITLWETIEHLPDPAAALGRIKEWLAPDGVLVIGTGDNSSSLARLLGARWWYINPPDHAVYYNPRALRIALERQRLRLEAFYRIHTHRVSSRNVVMKLLRSVRVAGGRALRAARAVPDLPLVVPHGTTMVAVATR